MSRVLLCGAFGQDNPGDDALLDAFVRALADHDLTVALDGHTTTGGTRCIPTDPRAVAEAVRGSDAVVVAGGTVFKSLHTSTGRHHLGLLARTRLLVAGAHAAGGTVALVGVGAGELRSRTAARLAASIADHADVLVLRDEESAAVLRTAGAAGPFRIGADPAWTLPSLVATRAVPTDAPVVVALSHLATDDIDDLADRLTHVVVPLARQGVPVHLQPWQAGERSDEYLARAVLERAGDDVQVVDRPSSLHEAVTRYGDARAVVGLRHHALVAAAAAGRPFLALSHEPKLAGLSRRLGQRSVPPHAPHAVLARAAVELLPQAPPAETDVLAEIEAAHQTMRLLRVVVSGGDDDDQLDRDHLALTDHGSQW